MRSKSRRGTPDSSSSGSEPHHHCGNVPSGKKIKRKKSGSSSSCNGGGGGRGGAAAAHGSGTCRRKVPSSAKSARSDSARTSESRNRATSLSAGYSIASHPSSDVKRSKKLTGDKDTSTVKILPKKGVSRQTDSRNAVLQYDKTSTDRSSNGKNTEGNPTKASFKRGRHDIGVDEGTTKNGAAKVQAGMVSSKTKDIGTVSDTCTVPNDGNRSVHGVINKSAKSSAKVGTGGNTGWSGRNSTCGGCAGASYTSAAREGSNSGAGGAGPASDGGGSNSSSGGQAVKTAVKVGVTSNNAKEKPTFHIPYGLLKATSTKATTPTRPSAYTHFGSSSGAVSQEPDNLPDPYLEITNSANEELRKRDEAGSLNRANLLTEAAATFGLTSASGLASSVTGHSQAAGGNYSSTMKGGVRCSNPGSEGAVSPRETSAAGSVGKTSSRTDITRGGGRGGGGRGLNYGAHNGRPNSGHRSSISAPSSGGRSRGYNSPVGNTGADGSAGNGGGADSSSGCGVNVGQPPKHPNSGGRLQQSTRATPRPASAVSGKPRCPTPPDQDEEDDEDDEKGLPQAVRRTEGFMGECDTCQDIMKRLHRDRMESIARFTHPQDLIRHLHQAGYFGYNYSDHSRTTTDNYNLRHGMKKGVERLYLWLSMYNPREDNICSTPNNNTDKS